MSCKLGRFSTGHVHNMRRWCLGGSSSDRCQLYVELECLCAHHRMRVIKSENVFARWYVFHLILVLLVSVIIGTCARTLENTNTRTRTHIRKYLHARARARTNTPTHTRAHAKDVNTRANTKVRAHEHYSNIHLTLQRPSNLRMGTISFSYKHEP